LIEDEVLRFGMTAALSAATVYCAFRAGSKSPMIVRVNYALHALMTLAMIGMLFHGWNWPLLPQLLAFALGTWWFTVQASSSRARPGIRRGSQPRSKSLYDALFMAAMVFMLATPEFAGTQSTPGSNAHGGSAASVGQGTNHGAGAADGPVTLPATDDRTSAANWTGAVTSALAIVFAVACVLWAVRLVRSTGSGFPTPSAPFSRGRALRFADLGNEFVSAWAMAIMFAVLAA
jgi:hypothetical protein